MDKRNPSYRVNSGPKMASPSYGPPSRQLTAIAETQTDIPTSQSTSKTSEDILEQSGVTLDLSRPYEVCKAERNKWIHYIHHIQSLVKSSGLRNPSESEIVSLM